MRRQIRLALMAITPAAHIQRLIICQSANRVKQPDDNSTCFLTGDRFFYAAVKLGFAARYIILRDALSPVKQLP